MQVKLKSSPGSIAIRPVGAHRAAGAHVYRESFESGPGGWWGFIDNFRGPKALEYREQSVTSRSPWWVDYNHAPPGAGYLNMVFCLNTVGPVTEQFQEVAGRNHFVCGGFPLDFTGARFTVRIKGELLDRGSQLLLLVQGTVDGVTSGWALVAQPITVTREWSEQCLSLSPDESQWICLGSRHDRTDTYGSIPLKRILSRVNCNIMLINFPLDIEPMGPLRGDPHRLRAGKDYPLWQHRLPEGYVTLDTVEIRFASEAAV